MAIGRGIFLGLEIIENGHDRLLEIIMIFEINAGIVVCPTKDRDHVRGHGTHEPNTVALWAIMKEMETTTAGMLDIIGMNGNVITSLGIEIRDIHRVMTDVEIIRTVVEDIKHKRFFDQADLLSHTKIIESVRALNSPPLVLVLHRELQIKEVYNDLLKYSVYTHRIC